MEKHSDIDFKLDMPKFATEAEEAAWWPTQEDKLLEIFKNAAENGTLRRGNGKVKPSEPITLRMDAEDLKLAKNQAAREGLPYQTYIKSLLHKALEAAQQRCL